MKLHKMEQRQQRSYQTIHHQISPYMNPAYQVTRHQKEDDPEIKENDTCPTCMKEGKSGVQYGTCRRWFHYNCEKATK